jgi:hypothetical protein
MQALLQLLTAASAMAAVTPDQPAARTSRSKTSRVKEEPSDSEEEDRADRPDIHKPTKSMLAARDSTRIENGKYKDETFSSAPFSYAVWVLNHCSLKHSVNLQAYYYWLHQRYDLIKGVLYIKGTKQAVFPTQKGSNSASSTVSREKTPPRQVDNQWRLTVDDGDADEEILMLVESLRTIASASPENVMRVARQLVEEVPAHSREFIRFSALLQAAWAIQQP